MPTRDIYHTTVRRALEKDGWTITQDPFRLRYGKHRLFADLGAEKLFVAEKRQRTIVVEVKSFIHPSEVTDLKEALGAYELYRHILAQTDPTQELYLAVPHDTYEDIFKEPLGQLMITAAHLRLIVFDPAQEIVSQWIP